MFLIVVCAQTEERPCAGGPLFLVRGQCHCVLDNIPTKILLTKNPKQKDKESMWLFYKGHGHGAKETSFMVDFCDHGQWKRSANVQ